MHMLRRKPIDARQLDLKETVVEVRRVTKVVKGGRNFRFAALVVVGDESKMLRRILYTYQELVQQYLTKLTDTSVLVKY